MFLYHSEIRAVQEHINHLGGQVIETDCIPVEHARMVQENQIHGLPFPRHDTP